MGMGRVRRYPVVREAGNEWQREALKTLPRLEKSAFRARQREKG